MDLVIVFYFFLFIDARFPFCGLKLFSMLLIDGIESFFYVIFVIMTGKAIFETFFREIMYFCTVLYCTA